MAVRALVFLSALLLFMAEPLAGRMILPDAGGGAHVWTAALMFFQGALLLGYLYCHWVAPRIGRWHLLVAGLPLATMPLSADVDLDPGAPVWSVLAALITGIAPAFVVLSTTAVLAQMWRARTDRSDDRTYGLYATSNAGALTALLCYPIVVSPFLSLRTQSWVWSAGYLLFLVLLWRCCPPATRATEAPARPAARPPVARIAAWLILAATPSALLLTVTQVIAQEVGSAPLVWVIPLALYFASFVLVFRERSLYPPFVRRFWLEIAAVGLVLFFLEDGPMPWWLAVFHLCVLLSVSVAAHATLYRSKPPKEQLTYFYVAIAVGGWAGAAFVALVAPRIFVSFAEYPIAIAIAIAAIALVRRRDLVGLVRGESRILLAASAVFLVFLGSELVRRTPRSELNTTREGAATTGLVHVRRNAYGIHRVIWQSDPRFRVLMHGTIAHGKQHLAPGQRRRPLGYYARESPLGDVLAVLAHPRTAAVIGLGAGTIAAHFEAGESVVFYELDPDVIDIARTYFTYLEDTPADVQVISGDGRVQLATNELPRPRFDIIVVDAFTGDSIPTHMLTREAIEVYLRRLEPHGYVAFHISNRVHDLRPVLRAAAEAVGAQGAYKDLMTEHASADGNSSWFVIARDPALLTALLRRGWVKADDASGLPSWSPWTDDYVNLWRPFLAKR